MSDFNELKPYMKVTILIDPETMDYQVDLDGTLNVIKAALLKVAEDLDKEEVIDQLAIEPN